jgi:hypothetical protein
VNGFERFKANVFSRCFLSKLLPDLIELACVIGDELLGSFPLFNVSSIDLIAFNSKSFPLFANEKFDKFKSISNRLQKKFSRKTNFEVEVFSFRNSNELRDKIFKANGVSPLVFSQFSSNFPSVFSTER